MTVGRSQRRRGAGAPVVAGGFVALGVLVLAAALGWRVVVTPSLLRFPASFERHTEARGVVTLFVDPVSTVPLAVPRRRALVLEERMEVVAAATSAARAVVRDTVYVTAGDDPAFTLDQQFVIDRRAMANVADARSWGFDADAVVDRSGSFTMQLPRHVGADEQLELWMDAVGRPVPIVAGGPASAPASDAASGLDLVGYTVHERERRVADAYRRALRPLVALPDVLAGDVLAVLLQARGVDLDAVAVSLDRASGASGVAAGFLAAARQPISVFYVDSFSGTLQVEPTTGAVVARSATVEQIGAVVESAALVPLIDRLTPYAADPVVAGAVNALAALGRSPTPVVGFEHAQTPASVRSVAGAVRHEADRVRLVERTLPLTLALIGVLLVAVPVAMLSSGRRRGVPHAPPRVRQLRPLLHH